MDKEQLDAALKTCQGVLDELLDGFIIVGRPKKSFSKNVEGDLFWHVHLPAESKRSSWIKARQWLGLVIAGLTKSLTETKTD